MTEEPPSAVHQNSWCFHSVSTCQSGSRACGSRSRLPPGSVRSTKRGASSRPQDETSALKMAALETSTEGGRSISSGSVSRVHATSSAACEPMIRTLFLPPVASMRMGASSVPSTGRTSDSR